MSLTASLFVSTLGFTAALQGHSLAYLDFSDGRERLELAPVDDARTNRSHLITTAAFPPFRGDRQTRVRVAEAANALFADYDVSFTIERPADGDYDMILVGGSATEVDLPATVLGAAVLDCGNTQRNQIAFVFADAIEGGPEVIARAVAQELAHTYGLEHTIDPDDVMFPQSIEGRATFVDVDRGLAAEPRCGQPMQNSRQRLLTAVGAWPAASPKPVGGLDSLAVDVTSEGGCRVAAAAGGPSPLAGLAGLAGLAAWRARRRGR